MDLEQQRVTLRLENMGYHAEHRLYRGEGGALMD